MSAAAKRDLCSLGLVALLAAGCAGAQPGGGDQMGVATGKEPQYGGVLRMRAGGQELPSYDPRQTGVSGQSYQVIGLVYGQLVRFPFARTAYEKPIVCDLCEKWEVSPDGKSYTFRLRNGVRWHNKAPLNGRELTAEDIRWALSDGDGYSSKDPRVERTFRNFAGLYGGTVSAPDKSTVAITIKDPAPDFLIDLAQPNFTYPARESVQASKTADNPQGFIGLGLREAGYAIGTGPFMLKEYTPGVGGTLVKNPDYFLTDQILNNGNKLPYLDEVQVLLIPDHKTRTAAMMAGQLDTGGVYLDDTDIEQLRATNEFQVDLSYTGFAPWFIFNAEKPPFNDVRVRKALHLIANRQELLQVSNMRESQPQRWIPSSWEPWGQPQSEVLKLPGYRPDKSADIAQAKQLLTQAGLGSNFSFTISAEKGGLDVEHATVFQAQLKQAGISAAVDPLDRATYRQRELDGSFEVAASPQICAGPSPSDCLGKFLLSEAKDFHRWSSPELDALIKKQSGTLDVPERAKIIRQAMDLIDEGMPGVSTYRAPWYRAVRKGFHNVIGHPRAGGLVRWTDHIWKER